MGCKEWPSGNDRFSHYAQNFRRSLLRQSRRLCDVLPEVSSPESIRKLIALAGFPSLIPAPFKCQKKTSRPNRLRARLAKAASSASLLPLPCQCLLLVFFWRY